MLLTVLLSVSCGFRGNGIKHIRHSEHGKYQNWRAGVPNHDTVISCQICMDELHMEEFRIKNSYYNVQRNFLKNTVLI